MKNAQLIEISLMSANWVARQLGYAMTEGWGQGDKATNAYFEPLETYRERLAELMSEAKRLGFRKLDLWTGHLNWKWATDVHISIVKDLAKEYGLALASYAGGFGDTPEDFEKACRTARSCGIEILGGSTALLGSDNKTLDSILKRHRLKLAYENHPEKTSEELLARVEGTDEETVGVCIDTGWFGTHGYDAAQAIHEVRDRLFYVHLKDVLAPGEHKTCAFGAGCVPIERCVEMLRAMKYLGGVSVEHEPEDHDPADEMRESRLKLERWLA